MLSTFVLVTTITTTLEALRQFSTSSARNNWACPNLDCGRMGLAPHDHTGMISVLFIGMKFTERKVKSKSNAIA